MAEIKNTLTYQQLMKLTDKQITETASLPLDQLFDVQDEIDNIKEDLKLAEKNLNRVLVARSEVAGRAALRAQNKDTGSITMPQGDGLGINFDVSKKVEWDQKLLMKLVEQLAAEGEDIKEYVDIKLSVPEAKFKVWPQKIRARFQDARTVKDAPPKAKIVVTKKDD